MLPSTLRSLALACGLTLFACGGGGGGVEFVDADGKATTIEPKGTVLVTLTATNTLATKEVLRASHARVYVANYAENIQKDPTADGQARLYFSLNGKKGTDHQKDPVPVGRYTPDAPWEMRASDFELRVFEGGKVQTKSLRGAVKGAVEVTKSTLDEIEGTIDVTTDKGKVRGPFHAKLSK